MRGFVGKILDWFESPGKDETTATQWFAGLVVILIVSFMWSTIVNRME